MTALVENDPAGELLGRGYERCFRGNTDIPPGSLRSQLPGSGGVRLAADFFNT